MVKYLYSSSDIIAYFQRRFLLLRHNKRQAPWDRQRCASSSWQVFLLIFFSDKVFIFISLRQGSGTWDQKSSAEAGGKDSCFEKLLKCCRLMCKFKMLLLYVRIIINVLSSSHFVNYIDLLVLTFMFLLRPQLGQITVHVLKLMFGQNLEV